MVAGGIYNVQLVYFAPDSVQFPVKVFYRRRVRVLEFTTQEPSHQRRLAHTRRPEKEEETEKCIGVSFDGQ